MPLTFDEARALAQSGKNYDPGTFLFDATGRPMTITRRYVGKDAAGKPAEKQFAYDSTGGFLQGELERLDQTDHPPLIDISYPRDISLRQDVSSADEVSSFTVRKFFAPGGLGTGNPIGGAKSWATKGSNEAPGISVDIAVIKNPLVEAARTVSYTIFELEAAAKLGRPVDQQKINSLYEQIDLETDALVYVGDTDLGFGGLVNFAGVNGVTPGQINAPAGAQGGTSWFTKSPDEIIADVAFGEFQAWANSAFAVVPTELRIPPNQYSLINKMKVGTAGERSLLTYLEENSLAKSRGKKLNIQPLKWLQGAAAGGTLGTPGNDRSVFYTNDPNIVRIPRTLQNRTPVQFQGVNHNVTYYWKYGRIEVVYPQTLFYLDLI